MCKASAHDLPATVYNHQRQITPETYDMTTMGHVDTYDLMKVMRWNVNKSFRPYRHQRVLYTHTSPYIAKEGNRNKWLYFIFSRDRIYVTRIYWLPEKSYRMCSTPVNSSVRWWRWEGVVCRKQSTARKTRMYPTPTPHTRNPTPTPAIYWLALINLK